MAIDRFAIALTARTKYEEDLGKRLGINPHSEYGRKKLNEYLEEQRRSDELSASIHLQNSNPGKFFSISEIRAEARKIERKRLEPYFQEAIRIKKTKEQQEISDVDTTQTNYPQEIKMGDQYTTHKDSYTYRQILIGLRNEFLKIQKKLDQLSDYVLMFEDTMGMFPEKRDEYYFNLHKNPFGNEMPELVLDRTVIRKRLSERLGLSYSPTRAFMVKDNNGVYYPLRRHWFEEYQFNMVIKPGCEKEFQECVEDILNSDFARYMQLSGNISAVTYAPITYKKTPIIIPSTSSFGFNLHTTKSEIKYLGRNDIIEFASVRKPNEKWEPLTQGYLDYISSIQFPKDSFSEYHQSIIDKSIDDDRPIVLSEQYKPETHTKLEIQDDGKKLTLVKSQNRRSL